MPIKNNYFLASKGLNHRTGRFWGQYPTLQCPSRPKTSMFSIGCPHVRLRKAIILWYSYSRSNKALGEGMPILALNTLVDGAEPKPCAWCGRGFYGRRFCSRECGVEFHMAERRVALALLRSLRQQEVEDEWERVSDRARRSA